MKFISKKTNLIGIALLVALSASAAALYFGMPVRAQRPAPVTAQSAKYVCPMHPEVTSAHPGKCPECLMALVPAASGSETSPETAPANAGCCSKTESKAFSLPPGHPPVAGYDNPACCPAGGGVETQSTK